MPFPSMFTASGVYRLLIIAFLSFSLVGCTHQIPSSSVNEPLKNSPTGSYIVPDNNSSAFISRVTQPSTKTPAPVEPAVKSRPPANRFGQPSPKTTEKINTTTGLPGDHTLLGQENIDYDQQSRARLRRSVFKKLGLSSEQPFNIVDATAVGIKFNRTIKISSANYQGSLGSLEIQRGTFDVSLNSSANRIRDYTMTPPLVQSDTTSLSVALTKMFRSGIRVTVGEDATGGDYNSMYGDAPQTESNLKFQVVVPLLKGRGQVSAAAAETSAELTAKAAGMTTEHAFATAVETIGNDYWDYLQAIDLLKLAIDAECRSEKILADTKVLVQREAKPRSLLSSLEADLATKRAQLFSREQEVFRSRNQLALDLGIPVRNAALLPIASMAFPDFQLETTELLLQHQNKLYAIALKRRKDLQSARLDLKSQQVLEDKTKRDLLPELNLTLGNNYHGFADGNNGSTFADAFRGANSGYIYGLTLSIPLQNNTARGQLRLQRAQTERSQLTLKQLQEQIYNDVVVAANGLYQARAQLAQQRLAQKMYSRALNDEILRFHLNKATLLDVMDAEDRLNNAQSSVVTAQASVAKALITLRYQTGTLFSQEKNGRKGLTIRNFTTLPISDL